MERQLAYLREALRAEPERESSGNASSSLYLTTVELRIEALKSALRKHSEDTPEWIKQAVIQELKNDAKPVMNGSNQTVGPSNADLANPPQADVTQTQGNNFLRLN